MLATNRNDTLTVFGFAEAFIFLKIQTGMKMKEESYIEDHLIQV